MFSLQVTQLITEYLAVSETNTSNQTSLIRLTSDVTSGNAIADNDINYNYRKIFKYSINRT